MFADIESGIVRNMVNEIVRECAVKRIQIHKNFATFLTNLLLIDPNWDIGEDFMASRERVEIFVKYVIEELLSKQESPKVVTLKIQHFFDCNSQYSPTIVQMSKNSFKKKIRVLFKDIIACRKLETKESVDLLYKKMAYYMTLVTGLGNPTEPRVYAEALAALKSILKQDYLMEFIKFSKNIKKEEFHHFNAIVAGIRLYNRHIKMGGAGIPNLPDLLYRVIATIKSGIHDTLKKINEKSQLLTFVISQNYAIAKTTQGYNMEVRFFGVEQQNEDNIDYMKDLLVFFKQYEFIVKVIQEDVEAIEEELDQLDIKMKRLLTITHCAIFKKVAIPAEIVFPLFTKLWSLWEKFQNKAILLKRIIAIMTNLQTYATQTQYQNLKLGKFKNVNEAGNNKCCLLSKRNPKITMIQIEKWNNMENVELEYLGVCPWTLLQTDGALIPGDPDMGVAEFDNKFYAFACSEAFQEFEKDPELCVKSILELARKQPQLINLFQLTEELENVHDIKDLIESRADIRAYKEKSTQTKNHMVVKSNIDINYHWNVWDLKRHALTLAAMSHCKTKSTQSDKTSSKTHLGNQTYSTEKQVATQTHKNTGSNGPRPSVFIYGLRDRKANGQFKIDLTLPCE